MLFLSSLILKIISCLRQFSQVGNWINYLEMKKMKTKLTSFEKQMENAANSFRPVNKKRQQKIDTIIAQVRKSRTVNIRITESVLEELKRRSQEEGLPYQTLISSILHKYVTNRLVDEEAIRKSLQLLR